MASKAKELLNRVEIGEGDYKKFPTQLSGGQQQRVAVVRGVINDPEVLFADEPTGALDQSNKEMVMDHLFKLVREQGVALLIVTHDLSIAERCDKVIELVSGSIMNEGDR